MNELQKLKAVAARLKLPIEEYLLGGSAAMVLHGIDRELGDVDVFTTTKNWFMLVRTPIFVPVPFRYFHGEIVIPDGQNHRRFDPPILRYNMGDLNLKVDVFYSWKVRKNRTDTDLVEIWDNHRVMASGFPTTSLEWLRGWKEKVGRPKDVEDIRLIDDHLDATTEITYFGP